MAPDQWTRVLKEVGSKTSCDERLLRMAVSLSQEPLPQYNWVRLGEGFSVQLALELLGQTNAVDILDPFAGSGTTLVACSRSGRNGRGIEIMPSCASKFEWLRSWPSIDLEQLARQADLMRSMRIFQDRPPFDRPADACLFGLDEEDLCTVASMRSFLATVPGMPERTLLQAATLLALRDRQRTFGNLLRFDRNGRLQRKSDHVPLHRSMESAFALQLTKMIVKLVDMETIPCWDELEDQELTSGSVVDVLPTLDEGSFDAVITSPPYFNGFDYSIEYALEHWFLGLEEELDHVKRRFLNTGMELMLSKARSMELERFEARLGRAGCHIDDFVRGGELFEWERNAFLSYLLDMDLVLNQLSRVLRDNGTITYVLDDAVVGPVDIALAPMLTLLADAHGLSLASQVRYGTGKMPSRSRLRRERQRTAIIKWEKR